MSDSETPKPNPNPSVRASTRVSIAWAGGEAYEDTDTVVLTIDGWCVDLRSYLESKEGWEGIEWASVARVHEMPGSTPDKPILQWEKLLDSHPASEEPDEGTFETLPSGLVQESGAMYNPATDKVENYIEIWKRYPYAPGDPYAFLEREDGKVFLGRVGKRVVGVGKIDSDWIVWRDELEGEEWRRVVGVSSESQPLGLDIEDWTEGDEITSRDAKWTVRKVGRL